MSAANIEQLNKQYSFDNGHNYLRFTAGKGDITLIDIQNSQARAVISLQGAQLLSWIPTGRQEIIWLSEKAHYTRGKAIRGGIPICWPWFGPHGQHNNDANPEYPAHGFARTSDWQVICTEDLNNEKTRITFILEPQPDNAHMWPPQTSVQFQITIGHKLEMELITHNNGDDAIVISEALHTYFRVADVTRVFVHGLEDTPYLDKLADFRQKIQHGPLIINQETDRIYLDTISECIIEDRELKRNIIINKLGSHSTVVWNPWQESAAKLNDMDVQGYKNMLCVESSNAAKDCVRILPGKAHHLWVQYEVNRSYNS